MQSVTAVIEAGVVRMEEAPAWRDGQRVLVIALPADDGAQLLAPPAELLEEDAREMTTKPEAIRAATEDEPRVTILAGAVHLADIFEGGSRPVVVVSREQLNRGAIVLCVPFTSSRTAERRKYANYVFVPAGAGGLREDSVAVAHLVQPVRTTFFREAWGTLPENTVQRILFAIGWSVGLIELPARATPPR